MLAKSCKMIPVMIMGTLVGGKRYSVIEYVCSGLIAGGISLFAAQVDVVACCLANAMHKSRKSIVHSDSTAESALLLVSKDQPISNEFCRAQAKWPGSWLPPTRRWVMDCASSI